MHKQCLCRKLKRILIKYVIYEDIMLIGMHVNHLTMEIVVLQSRYFRYDETEKNFTKKWQLRFQKRKTPAGGFSYQHLWYC